MTNIDSILHTTLQNTCKQGLEYISCQQRLNGSFSDTTFYTSRIVAALASCDDEASTMIRQRCVAFLVKERSDNWSYNYWQKNSTTYTKEPYPDDLDDTFLAFYAIALQCPGVLDEHAWHAVTSLLIHNETIAGGPYQTWLLPVLDRAAGWDDVDLVVNANIAIFLHYFDIKLAGLQHYLDDTIRTKKLYSRYYHNDMAIMYFLAKAYRGDNANTLRDMILEKRNIQGYWNSPLDTALAITSLLLLGEIPATLFPAIDYLIHSHDQGCWPDSPFFIESRHGNTTTYSHYPAHLSACCVEALCLYEEAIQKAIPDSESSDLQVFIDSTITACEKQCRHNTAILQDYYELSVIHLPYYFFTQFRSLITIDTAIALSAATMLGWIGYTIADKIVDGEKVVAHLPIALKCIREMNVTLLREAGSDHSLMVQRILDGIEQSVSWEHASCVLTKNKNGFVLPHEMPSYGDLQCLAEKSLGYALAPMIMCCQANMADETAAIEYFFVII